MRKKVTVVGGGFVGSTTAAAQYRGSWSWPIVVLTDILDVAVVGEGARYGGIHADNGLRRACNWNFDNHGRLQRHGEQRHRGDHSWLSPVNRE